MLNFNDLQPVVESTFSFVGIAKRNDSLQLHLPKGYTASTVCTYNQKRDIFFSLYRILRQFKAICIEKGYLKSDRLQIKTSNRDGVLKGEDGQTLVQGNNGFLVFYAKLNWIDSLLDAYDELKIAALVQRLGRTEKIDYSQLHRFLHQGVFLNNGNIYIDTMTLPRSQVQFESTDIVAMYCYLVEEVKAQLGDPISSEVKALSEGFREKYLGIEASLFDNQDFELVLNELKDALDKIDHHTSLKDEDYYTFYEAIERFLYETWQSAEEGEIWGINNFHMVWESMCLTHLVKTINPEYLLWIERQLVPDALLQKLDATPKWFDLSEAFKCNGKKLRPDAIVFPSFAPSAPPKNIYYLGDGQRNDFGYQTYCSVRLGVNNNGEEEKFFEEIIKIVYDEQTSSEPTFAELDSHYTKLITSDFNLLNKLLIDHPLPENFYSYWLVDDRVLEHWYEIKYFNHIFHVFVKRGFWKFEEFKQELASLSGASPDANRPQGVFGESLFRLNNESFKDLPTWDDIQKNFHSFVKQILQFQVIDMKYQDAAYFRQEANRDEIKNRSIRKQFIYEYLLQESIKEEVDSKTPIRIDSSFWIPHVNDGDEVIFEGEPYLDGYLKLTNINLNALMNDYCNPAEDL